MVLNLTSSFWAAGSWCSWSRRAWGSRWRCCSGCWVSVRTGVGSWLCCTFTTWASWMWGRRWCWDCCSFAWAAVRLWIGAVGHGGGGEHDVYHQHGQLVGQDEVACQWPLQTSTNWGCGNLWRRRKESSSTAAGWTRWLSWSCCTSAGEWGWLSKERKLFSICLSDQCFIM